MRKLVALTVAIGLVVASLFVLPTVESTSSQVFSAIGHANGDGGD